MDGIRDRNAVVGRQGEASSVIILSFMDFIPTASVIVP
jgi:hypothetical protein